MDARYGAGEGRFGLRRLGAMSRPFLRPFEVAFLGVLVLALLFARGFRFGVRVLVLALVAARLVRALPWLSG